MERIGSPSQLPGAEVVLPGLLVEVSENQEEQQSNYSRYYNKLIVTLFMARKQQPQPE